MNTEIPVQVDGEPWLQAPCAITILKSALRVLISFFNFYLFKIIKFGICLDLIRQQC